MAELKVNDISKTFGKVVAVDNISFDAKDQEFVVLLGPSGCGKTTTMRMIAGLETPDKGSVEIGGVDVTYMAPHDRNIGMVFERYALYPHLSVFENIAYPLRVRRCKESEIRSRVNEVAKTLRITDLLGRRVTQLSGGQMQRVAIGRAIIRDAALFLLDEPISHLDAKLRSHMRGELKRILREFKATAVLVTHDQLEAVSMGDRIAVINEGKVQQFETPARIFNLPANRFVANFVGEPSMNFISCTLAQEAGSYYLLGKGFKIGVAAEWLKSTRALTINSGSLTFGVRPEHMRLHARRRDGVANLVDGRIYVVEPLGTEIIYSVEVGDTIVRVKAMTEQMEEIDVDMGDPVVLEFPSETLYLFDEQTGGTVANAQFALAREVRK
jgi:multiple sugar transport system ATP-binding protein